MSRVLPLSRRKSKDLPFTLLYLLTEDGEQARLACQTGMSADHPAAPEFVQIERISPGQSANCSAGKIPSSLRTYRRGSSRFPPAPGTSRLGERFCSPSRVRVKTIRRECLLPRPNPYRPLDVSYAGFLNLVAGQIAASIANARAYAAEKKRAEALAEIDRAKTAFFSNVSHEFRTPLTLMLGPLQDLLARSQTHLSPTAKEQLDLVNRNGARLLRLVNTLLDFSRLEAGRVQAVYQPRIWRASLRIWPVYSVPPRTRQVCGSSRLPRSWGARLCGSRYVGENCSESDLQRLQIHLRGRNRGQSAPSRKLGRA